MDYGRLLARTWNLGDSNNKLVVIIVGKNMKMIYRKEITSKVESRASVPAFLKTIRSQIR